MRYLNSLRNQWIVAKAWMFTTVLLAAFCIYLLISLGRAVGDMPTRLVPYGFDALNGPVKVSSTGRTSEEYLAQIATSDLKSYTDWTPRTVRNQYGMFANRMTPPLYAKIGTDLIVRADEIAESERSQAFFISHTEATEEEVRISGTLRVWQGRELLETEQKVYVLGYQYSRGIPKLNAFRSREGK